MDMKKEYEIKSEQQDLCSENQHQQLLQQNTLLNAYQFYQFSKKDKKIKIMDEVNPIFSNIYLKDISLHKKGPLQDKIYAKYDKYYLNIRRGNTLCQIYKNQKSQNLIIIQNQNKVSLNKENKQYQLFFCKRGMKKFYDLQPNYLKIGVGLSSFHKLMRRRIFQDLQDQLQKNGAQYHIYCLFKQNGQHCQVSFIKKLNCWIFGSKNVAILARNIEDVRSNYHKQRFYWAKLVAQQFFNIISNLSQQKIQQFKSDLNGFTLLGQHCGNQNHQHITYYEKVQIIWYGLVDNNGKDHCQPVETCRKLLNKYQLKMSRCNQKKKITDKNTLFLTMWQMLRKVAEGTMNEEGQGSVMYIVCQRQNQQRTVAMCKLKTTQYLIFRRLRQMLKLNVSRKNTANHFQKYRFQIDQLTKHYFMPPKSIQYYLKIGQKAFKQASNNNEIDQKYLRYKFVEFVKECIPSQMKQQQKQKSQPIRFIYICLPRTIYIFQKYLKSNNIPYQYIFRNNQPIKTTTVYLLYMIPRLPQNIDENIKIVIPNYKQQQIIDCIKNIQQSKDLTKSDLITFIKSQDKKKVVRMLHQKIQAFKKNCLENKIPFITSQPVDKMFIQIFQKYNLRNFKQISNKKFNKYIILPLLIPGSGKSSLGQQLKSNIGNKIKWKIINSDQIRQQTIQSLSGPLDKLNETQAKKQFIQSKQMAYLKLNQILKQHIQLPLTDSHQYIYILSFNLTF